MILERGVSDANGKLSQCKCLKKRGKLKKNNCFDSGNVTVDSNSGHGPAQGFRLLRGSFSCSDGGLALDRWIKHLETTLIATDDLEIKLKLI